MRPGDIVLVHTPFRWNRPPTWPGVFIRFGAWLRKETRPYAHWNHAAVVMEEGLVLEAAARGIEWNLVSEYGQDNHAVVTHEANGPDRLQIVDFMLREVGTRYGYLSILWHAVLIIFGGKLVVDADRSWICSEIAAAALLRADIDLGMAPARVTPAHLAAYFGVTGP